MLTSVAMHHLDLDFAAICSGYADGWSPDAIHALGESLLPYAQLVAEQVSTQWVMEARHVSVAEGTRQEDIAQPIDGVEPRLEVNVAPPLTEPNVVQPESEQPLPSPVEPSVDATRRPLYYLE